MGNSKKLCHSCRQGREPRSGNLDDKTDCLRYRDDEGLVLVAGAVLLPVPVLEAGVVVLLVPAGGLLPIPERVVLLVLASPPVRMVVFTPGSRSPERVVVCGVAPLGVRTMVRDRMLVPVRTPPRSRTTTLRREGATITPIRQPRLQPWP